MPVIISLLRAVNVGGRSIAMSELRALYTSLGFQDVQSYVQSGNVIFRTADANTAGLAMRLEEAIERMVSFHSTVILRTSADLRRVVESNPFAGRADVAPARLTVCFLAGEPCADAPLRVAALNADFPEELHLSGRELYIHFPDGLGRSNLTPARLDKALGTTGTARNWNTVTKLLQMAETLEALA